MLRIAGATRAINGAIQFARHGTNTAELFSSLTNEQTFTGFDSPYGLPALPGIPGRKGWDRTSDAHPFKVPLYQLSYPAQMVRRVRARPGFSHSGHAWQGACYHLFTAIPTSTGAGYEAYAGLRDSALPVHAD